MITTFLHAADLHLDSPFSGLERSAPHVADALRDASLNAFDRVVQHAVERRVTFVVFAGDLYDGADRGLRAQLRFQRGVERLSAEGIDVFIAHGNHDPLEGWSVMRTSPERVHVFASGDVSAIPVLRGGENVATVHGVSYRRREETENLARRFRRSEAPGIHVGVLHCNVGALGDHANYAPCTVADLVASGMDYWALGHIHLRQTLAERAPVIAYSGNTQGRSFKPSERGAKGVNLVEADGGSVVSTMFLPTDSFRFVEEQLDVSSLEDLGALRERLAARADVLRREHAPCSIAVRARLIGACAFREDLARAEAIADLLRELRSGEDSAAPFVWWAELRDETHAGLDLDDAHDRGDLLGELAAVRRALLDDPARAQAFVRRALEGVSSMRDLARDGERAPSLVDAAARYLAARLMEREGR